MGHKKVIKGCRDDDKKAFLIDHLKSQANFPSAHGLVTDLVLEQVHYYLFSGKILEPFLAYEIQARETAFCAPNAVEA